MDFKSIFKKNPVRVQNNIEAENNRKPEVPDGLLKKCSFCGKGILTEEYLRSNYRCPKCGSYFRMPANERIKMITEPGTFEEWDTGLKNKNPLRLKGYTDRILLLKESLSLDEAVITGSAEIKGDASDNCEKVALMVMDVRFLTASMGEVVGEKITRGIERATEERLPVILICCSGGARMQEGMISLMQMAKTSAALKRHSDAGLLTVTVLTDPTTGGVTASFAMLGDIILAEEGALIGFAGPRVIEQTIRQKLPKGFQRAEFLLEHGFADKVVKREDMKEVLYQLIHMHAAGGSEAVLQRSGFLSKESSEEQDMEAENDRKALLIAEEGNTETVQKLLFTKKKEKTPWERVILSRAKDRPVAEDYIRELFPDFIELHGDRQFGDDPAIIGGIAYFRGIPVTVIAQMKGKDTKENVRRNFGMPKPEGYRKALRLMKQAEKFHRPVICFVDTPGAFCGMEAEERGQGEAIARNLFELSSLSVPVLSILIGEGGSGGALALAIADEVWILENATYSILSPEGFATILWKDSSLAEKAAKVMRLTSYDLYQMKIVEDIILEPPAYTTRNMKEVCKNLEQKIGRFIQTKCSIDTEELLHQRYVRFRDF